MSLMSLSDPVGVPTLMGYKMLLPEIGIRVRLGSDFWGRTSLTTLLKDISCHRSTGMFSHFMTKKVSGPANCCILGPYLPLPTPWNRRLSSFVYD